MSREAAPPRMDAWMTVALALWVAALAGICVLLRPRWAENPELMHGFLMPLALVFLLREARRRRHDSPAPRPSTTRWLCAGLSLLALLGAVAGLLYALVFGWSHALACTPLVLAFACLSLILLLGLAERRWLGFGWPGLCAAGLWLLCSPIPPGTYTRLSVALQLAVTGSVMGIFNALGIPAVRHGNVIELVRGNVGVEEACSGIRSLITCLFAAVLLSAALRMRPGHRLLLILLAAPLAWSLNLLRSLTLGLLTAFGGPPSPAWHDGLGYAVLSIATVVLLWLAFRFELPETAPAAMPRPPQEHRPALPSALILASLLPAVLLTTAFLLLPRQAPREASMTPDLEQWLATKPEGWEVRNGTLPEAAWRVLNASSLLQREYLQPKDGTVTDLVLYVAYWKAGASSPSGVALHTPEVCWPGAGWTELTPSNEPGNSPAQAEHRRFRHESGQVQEVWYWHLNGERPLHGLQPYEPLQLIRNALHQGFAPPLPQLFVRISSNRPWPEIRESEPVRHLLAASGISGLSTKP